MYMIQYRFSINLVYHKSGFLNCWGSDDLKSGIEINGDPCGKRNKSGSIPHVINQEKFQMDQRWECK